MLVGRDAEVADLADRVAERRTVLLTGPAGIGKTSLARASLDATERWAEAGALATLAWAPLLVFRRLLASDVGDDPATVAAGVLRRGFEAVLLDDLQWADTATLDVIAHLVDQIAVLATVRTGEERSALVMESLEILGAERVELAPLSVTQARQVVVLLHPDLPSSVQSTVVEQAGGNPLLLAELPTGGSSSPTLVSALLARLRALGSSGRVAAERLAVLGRPADRALLGLGAEVLVAAGLAAQEGALVVMRHDLLAEVIVDLLDDRADEIRRELAAEVSDSEAAHLLAAAGDRADARRIAGTAAAATDDLRARAELLELAIRCAPPEEADVVLRLKAARLFLGQSQPDRAAELCASAGLEGLGPEDLGALLSVEAQAAWLQGRPARSGELIEAALLHLRGTGHAEEVFALAGSTIFDTRLRLDGRPALQRAREAVVLSEEVGAHRAFTRLRLASVLLTADEPGWAELYTTVIDDARAGGDEASRRTALTSLVLAQWVAGDPTEAHRLAWDDVCLGPDHHHDGQWLANHAYAALIGLLVGVDQELLLQRHAGVLDDEPLFRNRPFLETAVGLAHADLGQHVEAHRHAAGAPVRAGHDPQARSVAWWLVTEVAWLHGRLEAAVDAGDEAADLPIGDYPSAVQTRLLAGHALRELGRSELRGPTPAGLLRAWRAAPLEWEGLAAAVQQRHREAAAGFEAAADAWRGHDVRSEARCRWAAADEARLAGSDDAVARLLVAVERAEVCRLAPLVARGRRSLRAAGVTSRARSSPGRSGLTTREEEVLRLVGTGGSSSEIAAALGVKVSTVDSFVRSASRKLGVPSRVAAAARLRELDQGPG